MKVKVEFTVDVNPDAWTLEYGIEGAAAIRKDVQIMAAAQATDHFDNIGVLR